MRIEFIDGLRGLFALSVVYAHYEWIFHPMLPMGFYGSSALVCGFFVISGFILSYRFWQNQNVDVLTNSSLRRYVRLTAAPLVSILVVYLILKLQLVDYVAIFSITNPPSTHLYFNFDPNLFDALYEGLWGMYFSYNQPTSYNPVLWTMELELKGSILVAAFLALFGKIKKRLPLYLIFIIITIDSLYLTFLFGVIFSDMLYSNEGRLIRERLKKFKPLSILCVVLGIFLTFFAFDSTISFYHAINFEIFSRLQIKAQSFYHIVAAITFIYAVIQLDFLQKIFSWKFFTKIGEYSFSLYLIHVPIALSVAGNIFLKLFQSNYSMKISILVAVLIGLLATIPAVFLLHKFVDVPAGRLAKRVQKFFA